MSFYGNITNVNKTQFTFDKTYPNRRAMDKAATTDGVFLGRYVLVEYSAGPDSGYGMDVFVQVYPKTIDGSQKFYIDQSYEANFRAKWTDVPSEKDPEKGSNDAFLTGQLVYAIEQDPIAKKDIVNFYQCTGSTLIEGIAYATFDLFSSNDSYPANYAQDKSIYGAGRGYDSTVWQKTFVNNEEKYVMIAELNTVVPSFGLSVDAPTMVPLTPHFDTESTNVYYKLHWQPQWGLRVAEVDAGKISDGQTTHYRESYDPLTGNVIKDGPYSVDAAIYFNRAGFDPANRSHVEISSIEDNTISILPTGISHNKYNKHNGQDPEEAVDIQEMRINLPAIGNMMSDAWDIIHGPNRNDDMRQVDENNNRVDSLQGRLDSIAAIGPNEIPIKRLTDGKLVGSCINGNNNRLDEEIEEILSENLSTSFSEDDAWIYTKIDPDRIRLNHNDGIAIHHTFHATADSESSINKNDGDIKQTETYKTDEILVENLTADQDKLRLYTPYVDAAGHIVGKNIETVTLPYSYRTYETSGLNATSNTDIYTTIVNDDSGANTSSATAEDTTTSASKTQDTITINPGNKWIQTKFEEDSLTIAHEIHAVDTVAKTTNLNNDNVASTNATDKITIQDTVYDMAGHVIQNRAHTYTLPYGFKTIKSTNTEDNAVNSPNATISNNGIVADTTQDTLNMNASNRWIKIDNSTEDTIQFGHKLSEFSSGAANTNYGLSENLSVAALDTDNTFEVPYFSFDEAGHINSAETHTVTLPDSFNKISITVSSTSNADDETGTSGDIVADTLTDTLTIAEGNKWINIHANGTDDKVTISHYVKQFNEDANHAIDFDNSNSFTVQDLTWDNAGHLTGSKKTTYTLQDGFKTLTINNDGNANTSVNYIAENGNLVASTQVDTATINAGNRWLTFIPAGKTVNMYHAAAGATSTSANLKENNKTTPNFGESFNVLTAGIDAAGHVKDLSSYAITLPAPSINALTATGSSVLTGISMESNTGKITQTNANVGSLLLADYSIAKNDDNDSLVNSSDTINSAFKKIDDRLDVEIERAKKAESDEATRATTAEQDLSTSLAQATADLNKAIADETNRAKAAEEALDKRLDAILDGVTEDELNTFKELSDALNDDKDYAATVTKAIAAEAKTRGEEDTKLQNQINALDITNGKVSKAVTADVANSLSDAAKVEVQAVKVNNATNADVAAEASGLNNDGIAAVKDVKVDNAGHADSADSATNAAQLDGVVAANYALKTDAQDYANTAESNAKSYADGLASNYATATQGQKAESALQLKTSWTYRENEEDEGVSYTIESLLKEIVNLKKQVDELTAKVNEAHPVAPPTNPDDEVIEPEPNPDDTTEPEVEPTPDNSGTE